MKLHYEGLDGNIAEFDNRKSKYDEEMIYCRQEEIEVNCPPTPLSKPILATIALFVFLNKWNDWNTALIYISEPELYSLQYLLQSIMENINMIKQNAGAAAMMQEMNIPSETIRMAMAVVVAGPALLVFPFFQKYFVKGLTVGAVKG